jgi:phosphomevalonate kinase
LAEQSLSTVPHQLHIDTAALRRDGRKIGLGSSAAGAAAAAAAVHAFHGEDLEDPEVRSRVLLDALEGHRRIAPEGSGADVAASVLGGFVRFVRTPAGPIAESIEWPESIATRVIWTGTEARTSDLVRAVRAFAEREPSAHRARMAAMGAASHVTIAAARNGDVAGVIAATDAYHQDMVALGEAAGAPIVTGALQKAAELAREHGGAAKPSGAGGGDVAIAVFANEERARAFDAACRAAPVTLEPLAIALGAEGIRIEAEQEVPERSERR